ncbi:MAG: hypothetical protein J7L96_03650 [Bacteroidales bacterium]|nr:hypothetical protein [Bacteroidales bacterium]
MYQDIHLSHVSQCLGYGYLGKVDIAIVETLAISLDGKLFQRCHWVISSGYLKR